jgi:hypothetical protein
MNRMNYQLLNRVLLRSEEIVAEPAMSSTVTNIYDDVLKSKAEAYRIAFDTIAVAESKHRQAKLEASVALKMFDNPYKAARASVMAVDPTRVLPATLSAQGTDTDTLYAIKTLVKAIKEYIGQTWADGLLSGEFGAASADVMTKLSASILANKAFAEAVTARAEAFDPAYTAFMAFKRVVRYALGPKSKQYKRLHIRSTKSAGEAEGEEVGGSTEEEKEATPGSTGPTASTPTATAPTTPVKDAPTLAPASAPVSVAMPGEPMSTQALATQLHPRLSPTPHASRPPPRRGERQGASEVGHGHQAEFRHPEPRPGAR